MLNTTVGQLLVNDVLPEELRDYHRTLDNKTLKGLLRQVASQHPEKYRDISHQLNQIGRTAAQEQGGMSFGINHLRKSDAARKVQQKIQGRLNTILADNSLSDKDRAEAIILAVHREKEGLEDKVLEEAKQKGNPLALQVLSGSRGKPMNLASLIASDMLYSDHRDDVIPIPVLRSYSEGLSPEEYWAGTYGARRGIIATKFATQEAGFLSKQLNQSGHRLVVMDEDAPEEQQDNVRGLIVDTDDSDNEGALLAQDTGPYRRNTPLTPKILNHLSRLGQKRILVRSPIIGGSPEGGVYARDVGVRENGGLPGRGEQVGLQAAQALSEPISQGQLSAKHSGGVAGKEKAVGGFAFINQLIQTPKSFMEGAAHATQDGAVQRIEPAPAGGQYVFINGQRHYVGAGHDLKIKKGDQVEAGDVISEGIPNPAIITQYKGVGEGRRYFVNEFKKAMSNSGMYGHRRNIELLARGLINHVRLTEETENNVPDDVIPYSTLEHTYKPRENHEVLKPEKAMGQYLERPVLHYTIGTQVKPSMLKNFTDFGVKSVTVHKNPPPFEPYMVRGMYQLQHDPDWMTQMYGSGLKKSLLNSVARGGVSEERGTSFVPSLAVGTDFGDVPDRAVVKPQAPYAVDTTKYAFSQIDPYLLPVKQADASDVPGAPVTAPKAPATPAPAAPQPIKPITTQTPAQPAQTPAQENPYSSWNSNLGKFKPIYNDDGSTHLETEDGNIYRQHQYQYDGPRLPLYEQYDKATGNWSQPRANWQQPAAVAQAPATTPNNSQPLSETNQAPQQSGMSPQLQTMLMLSLLGAGGGYGMGGGQGAMLGGMGLPLMYYLFQQMQKNNAPGADTQENDYDRRYREIQEMQQPTDSPPNIPPDFTSSAQGLNGTDTTKNNQPVYPVKIEQNAIAIPNPAEQSLRGSAYQQLGNLIDTPITNMLINRNGFSRIQGNPFNPINAGSKLYRSFVPGASFGMAGGARTMMGTAGGAKGIAMGLLPAMGGQTVFNAAGNVLDAFGLNPTWLGGKGIGNAQGWGQKEFDDELTQGVAKKGPIGYWTGTNWIPWQRDKNNKLTLNSEFDALHGLRATIRNPLPAGTNLAKGMYEINEQVPLTTPWLLKQTGIKDKIIPYLSTGSTNLGGYIEPYLDNPFSDWLEGRTSFMEPQIIRPHDQSPMRRVTFNQPLPKPSIEPEQQQDFSAVVHEVENAKEQFRRPVMGRQFNTILGNAEAAPKNLAAALTGRQDSGLSGLADALPPKERVRMYLDQLQLTPDQKEQVRLQLEQQLGQGK